MKGIRYIGTVACLMWGTFMVSAQTQDGGEFSLQQCREMAVKANKEAASARLLTEKMDYLSSMYRSNYFPNFKLEGVGVYTTLKKEIAVDQMYLPTYSLDAATGQLKPNVAGTAPDGSNIFSQYASIPGMNLGLKGELMYAGGVTLEQPIFMGGKITAAYKMSKLGRDMALLNESLTTQEVIVKTDEAYMKCVKAKELGEVAKKYNQMLAELLANVQSAYKHGLKPYNDVLRVQVKLNESELQMRRAENGMRLAAMNLCHYIGKPLTSAVSVRTDDIQSGERISSFSTDVTARPEFSILDKQTEIARQQVKLDRSDFLPNIGVAASYDYTHGLKASADVAGLGSKSAYLFNGGAFNALLNVSIPLFHFGEGRSKVRAAKAELARVQMQQSDKQELMQLELAQASNNLDEAYLECELTKKSLEQADENVRLSTRQYDAGLETLTDLMEAQVLWQQAYANEIDARCNCFVTKTKYLKACGQLAQPKK